MEYWKLRNEEDKRYLVVYGYRVEYEETFEFYAHWASFETLEEAYDLANKYEYKEVFEWFIQDTAVAVFLHRHFARKWAYNENLYYIFTNKKDKEVQVFTDVYTLMYIVAKYELIPNQFSFESQDENCNLCITIMPKTFLKAFIKTGYKQLGYVDFERGVCR